MTFKSATYDDIEYSGKELIPMKKMRRVRCRFCGELCDQATAHRHDGKWVGDECCWDKRLRSSE